MSEVDFDLSIMNENFNLCFKRMELSYFRNMMKIISEMRSRQSVLEKVDNIERHHVIPRSWFRINGLKLDNSEKNLVYLTPRQHLKVHVLLYYYFRVADEFEMAQKSLQTLYWMSRSGVADLKRYGDITEQSYLEYERRNVVNSGDMSEGL